MLCDPDRVYAALNDQLQHAFDDELRLIAVGEICKQVRDEYVVAHERVQALIERISAKLETSGL